MSRKLKVLADFSQDHFISEYLSIKQIKFDFLPAVSDTPLIDVIASKIEQYEKVVMFLNLNSMRRLFLEHSKFNKFNDMNKKIILVIYDDVNIEVMFNLFYFLDNETDLDPLPRDENLKYTDLALWINSLSPIILCDGRPGVLFDRHYGNCQFIQLHHPFLGSGRCHPHFSTLKKHSPTKDFFCLMCDKTGRPHRRLLYRKMEDEGLLDKGICVFKKRAGDTWDDLNKDYAPNFLSRRTWFDGVPPVSYYNKTNIEVVAESFGKDIQDNTPDNTFCITEKTTKPISMKHPFMVLSNYDFLKNLRDLGFRTFGDYIDESYDSEKDVNRRIQIITQNLKAIQDSSIDFYRKTKEIRDHNLENLQSVQGMMKTRMWEILDEFWRNI